MWWILRRLGPSFCRNSSSDTTFSLATAIQRHPRWNRKHAGRSNNKRPKAALYGTVPTLLALWRSGSVVSGIADKSGALVMDDIIANSYDAYGNIVPITMKECYQSYFNCLKLLYHDYMVRIVDGDFATFKKMQMKATAKIIDMVHNRNADHVEGIRMEFFKKHDVRDLRKERLDG